MIICIISHTTGNDIVLSDNLYSWKWQNVPCGLEHSHWQNTINIQVHTINISVDTINIAVDTINIPVIIINY